MLCLVVADSRFVVRLKLQQAPNVILLCPKNVSRLCYIVNTQMLRPSISLVTQLPGLPA